MQCETSRRIMQRSINLARLQNELKRYALVARQIDEEANAPEIHNQVPVTLMEEPGEAVFTNVEDERSTEQSKERESEKVDEIRLLRQSLAIRLKNQFICQTIPVRRGHKRCPFFASGCQGHFDSDEEVRVHTRNCFYGLFKICTARFCHIWNEEIFDSISLFSIHAEDHHECTFVEGQIQKNDISFIFNPSVWDIPVNGYSLVPLRRFVFEVEEEVVSLLFSVLIQHVGLDQLRVVIAPIVFGLNENTIHHVFNVQCTITGRDEEEILPISYPDFDEGLDVVPGTTTIRAFNSVSEIHNACAQLDGVLSFGSDDIRWQSYKMCNDNGIFNAVNIKLNFLFFPCTVIAEGERFPPAEFSATWNHLGLHDQVRATMDDGGDSRPSDVTSILVSQFKGQEDVFVETLEEKGVRNAVMASVMDHIVSSVSPADSPKKITAWIIYPTVAMMKKEAKEWQRRANILGIGVFVLDNNHPETRSNLMEIGCDILITNPMSLHSVLQAANAQFRDILIRDIKYVFLGAHSKNCFTHSRRKLQYAMDELYEQNGKIIKIAHVLIMHDDLKSHSRDLRLEEGHPQPSAIFTRGWNFFSIGRNPARFLEELQIQQVKFCDFQDRMYKTNGLIRNAGVMRWLVLGMNGRTGRSQTLLQDIGKGIQGYIRNSSRVKWLNRQRHVMMDPTFWDSFLEKSNSVLVGPYFLLDYEQCEACDGIIMLTEPFYPSEKVRIKQFVELPNNRQKPVYVFVRSQNLC